MKSEQFEQNDEPLRRVLSGWPVEAALPPRFQEGVWRRIELNETQTKSWTQVFARLLAGIGTPRMATSYVVVLLLAGILAGYWQARISNAHAEEVLSARYVQLVDPYQSPHH
jgi:hypothetical protein